MAQQFKKPYDVKLPKAQHEAEEFGAGRKGLVMCEKCNAVYFKKSWHHDLASIKISERKDLPIHFVLCPACQMIKNRQYEGRLIIKNVPEKLTEELEKLIEGFGRRAYDRDPMDRLIEIKKNKSEWIVTTTENQLANKLAKKIKDSFNQVGLKTHFVGDNSDVAEVSVEFFSSKDV